MDFAIIIGVNDYPYFRSLDGPHSDACSIYNWIVEENGGVSDPDRFKLILSAGCPDPKPIYDEIDDSFEKIFEYIDEHRLTNNRLYFYFSGHGLGLSFNEIALCLVKWSERRRDYALSSHEYLKHATESGRFNEVLFFLDCCRIRKIKTTGLKPLFPNLTPQPGAKYLVAFATEFQDSAYEVQMQNNQISETRGIFTKVLLDGLRGDAADENGIIDTETLKAFLDKNLPIEASKFRLSQKPDYSSSRNFNIKTVTPALADVTITISQKPNVVVLLDGDAEIITTFSVTENPLHMRLKKGTYTLVQKLGEKLLEDTAQYFTITRSENSYAYSY